LNSADS